MTNAKEEFLHCFAGLTVVAASLWVETKRKEIQLKANHTQEDYLTFLSQLDFEYDDGYGTQDLHGFVWFAEGSWAERGEYDGSEWWRVLERPELPKSLT